MSELKSNEQQVHARPLPVTDVDLAFGGKMDKLLPLYRSLPEEFQHEHDQFSPLVNRWFFSGLDKTLLKAKDGIDEKMAWRHLAAIMRSFEPKHEHKVAGVAWLMSQWFEPVTALDVAK